MKTRILSLATLLLVVFVMGGCASKPVVVKQDFWANTSKNIAVVVHELPQKMGLFKEGGQGLLDIAISAAVTQGVSKKLSELDPTPFVDVRTKFAEKLSAEGFTAINYEKLISFEDYPKREKKTGYSDVDLSQLFEETKADKIIVLQLKTYGASRSYYGFIPISDPQGLVSVEGMMVDEEQKVVWNTGSSISDSYIKEPVVGEWDQKPDYPNLIAAAERALQKSQTVLVDKFFVR